MLPNDSVENIIAHYASPNYDPVKAHDYYLKNRDLKGRRSTKGFTQKQREGFAFVKSQVSAKKKSEIDAGRQTKNQSIAQVREQAHQVRMDIAAKLKAFSEALSKQHAGAEIQITKDSREERHRIQSKLESDIAAIPEVPKNLPKAQRDRLLADRAEKIQILRDKAGVDRQSLTESTAQTRSSERADVKDVRSQSNKSVADERARVAGELKAVVAKFIEQYKGLKDQVKSKSEATLDREFQNIKTKVR
jgi:hypothetical protein